MSSLVVVPHHYLGFMYVISFFLALTFIPVSSDGVALLHDTRCDRILNNMSQDGDYIFTFFFLLFVCSLIATCAILPTGRYFMAIGGTEILAYSF
jgi:hypothetical protein